MKAWHFRKHCTIEMMNNETVGVNKILAMIEALTTRDSDIKIYDIKSSGSTFLLVKVTMFEYFRIKKAIERRYPGICKYYH